jgi:hypothetical protein
MATAGLAIVRWGSGELIRIGSRKHVRRIKAVRNHVNSPGYYHLKLPHLTEEEESMEEYSEGVAFPPIAMGAVEGRWCARICAGDSGAAGAGRKHATDRVGVGGGSCRWPVSWPLCTWFRFGINPLSPFAWSDGDAAPLPDRDHFVGLSIIELAGNQMILAFARRAGYASLNSHLIRLGPIIPGQFRLE